MTEDGDKTLTPEEEKAAEKEAARDKLKALLLRGLLNFVKGTLMVALALALWTLFGWLTKLAGDYVFDFETVHWAVQVLLLLIAVWVAARSLYPD